MEITTTKCKGRYERITTITATINTTTELLEYTFNRGHLIRDEWRDWEANVLQRATDLLVTTPTISQTELDLKIRFDVLNPNKTAKPNNVEHWINRGWTEDDARAHIKAKQKGHNNKKQEMLTVEYWVRTGLTLDAARQKADEYRFSNTARRPEYWIKQGLTEHEAIERVSQQQALCSPRSLKYWANLGVPEYVAKLCIAELQQHSADKAKEAWATGRISASTRNTNINYWLRKTDGDEVAARQALTARQTTFSLLICIEKLGPELGVQRWKERQIKWHQNFKGRNFSLVSQVLFKAVHARLPTDISDVFYATVADNGKNNESTLSLQHSVIKPDFYIPSLQVIVEFDGTYWHKVTMEDQYQHDCTVRDAAVRRSYPTMKIIHITEQQFKDDPEACATKIVDAILARHALLQAELASVT